MALQTAREPVTDAALPKLQHHLLRRCPFGGRVGQDLGGESEPLALGVAEDLGKASLPPCPRLGAELPITSEIPFGKAPVLVIKLV